VAGVTSVISLQLTKALRRAAVRATRAPSVHNTQPWRFVLVGDCLQIHLDPTRRLRVLDPRGSRALLSVGSALFNARVALAASGHRVTVERFPDPSRPNLVARVIIDEAAGPGEAVLAQLDPMIDVRRMNRREFSDESTPDCVVDALVDAANIEGGEAVAIVRPDDRLAVARLSQLADQAQNADPAHRAELRAWTCDDRGRWDDVPCAGSRLSEPVGAPGLSRDPDPRGAARWSNRLRTTRNQCLLLLGSLDDDPLAWLHAGEALERMLLELTRKGYVASSLTQVIEVASTRQELSRQLGLTMHPHVLLRVGRAPATAPTRRRRLVDVLTEAE
jgi:hypothetical protein